MSAYHVVRQKVDIKHLSPEQKAKLQSLKELEVLEKLASTVNVDSVDFPSYTHNE